MNIDLTPILQAIIALIAALITSKLIPWIKAKTTNEQQAMLRATVKTIVFAAEQIYGAGNGEEKLEYVAEMLREKGFEYDRIEVEAAVKEHLNNFIVIPEEGVAVVANATKEAE